MNLYEKLKDKAPFEESCKSDQNIKELLTEALTNTDSWLDLRVVDASLLCSVYYPKELFSIILLSKIFN